MYVYTTPKDESETYSGGTAIMAKTVNGPCNGRS